VGEESHKTVIFHHHVEVPFRNRSAPNLVFVDLNEEITPVKFGFKIFIGFSIGREVEKTFSFRKANGLLTVPRAIPCWLVIAYRVHFYLQQAAAV